MINEAPARSHVSPHYRDGAADIARRFHITIKTLRLYEKLGLLKPARTANGWRSYGQADCERLHVVLSLRQLGLSLKSIADLLDRHNKSVAEVLAMQEHALLQQRSQADEALAIVRRAKSRIAEGYELRADDLAELVRRVNAARFHWTEELAELAGRAFEAAEQRRIAANYDAAIDVAWAEVYPALAAVTLTGNPASAEALALGRRATELLKRMTGGDVATWNAMAEFWRAGFSDPRIAKTLPITHAQWTFLGRIFAELRNLERNVP